MRPGEAGLWLWNSFRAADITDKPASRRGPCCWGQGVPCRTTSHPGPVVSTTFPLRFNQLLGVRWRGRQLLGPESVCQGFPEREGGGL